MEILLILQEMAAEKVRTLFETGFFETLQLAQTGQLYGAGNGDEHMGWFNLDLHLELRSLKQEGHLSDSVCVCRIEPEMAFYDLKMNMDSSWRYDSIHCSNGYFKA